MTPQTLVLSLYERIAMRKTVREMEDARTNPTTRIRATRAAKDFCRVTDHKVEVGEGHAFRQTDSTRGCACGEVMHYFL